MKTTKQKTILSLAAAALLGTALYWYFSPFLDMRNMKSAAAEKNAAAFNSHVDYPRLRESFKEQLTARIANEASRSSGGASTAGLALAGAFIGPLVDGFVRPEMVMKLMAEGKAQSPTQAGQPGAADKDATKDTTWKFERIGFNTLIATGQSTTDNTQSAGFVFERFGFANWKLVEIKLPSKF